MHSRLKEDGSIQEGFIFISSSRSGAKVAGPRSLHWMCQILCHPWELPTPSTHTHTHKERHGRAFFVRVGRFEIQDRHLAEENFFLRGRQFITP